MEILWDHVGSETRDGEKQCVSDSVIQLSSELGGKGARVRNCQKAVNTQRGWRIF